LIFQSGDIVLLQSGNLGKVSSGLRTKSNVKQKIREGSVNWMEFAMRYDGEGLMDCSEVLLNYCDRDLIISEESKLKMGTTIKDGPRNKKLAQQPCNGLAQ
jgi:hypothetical protein